jgi:hypothetical protein
LLFLGFSAIPILTEEKHDGKKSMEPDDPDEIQKMATMNPELVKYAKAVIAEIYKLQNGRFSAFMADNVFPLEEFHQNTPSSHGRLLHDVGRRALVHHLSSFMFRKEPR